MINLHTSQDDNSPAALYQQVKKYIARCIANGTWKAGERISSEQELVTRFGVSRMTVNRALRELADQGMVVRVAGVGTFVAEARTQTNLLYIVNLAEEIRHRGHDYQCDVLVVARITASMEIASALQLSTGDSVFHTLCIHRENGIPVQLEDRYVNPQFVPDFMDQDFSLTQPSDYLLRKVPLDQIEHVVDATLPTAEQAHQLEIAAEDPCLVLTRRTWTHGCSHPVTYVRCIHPGARYRLGSRFRADPTLQSS
jgi:GntR family histidine utilization transcriptional repressor